MPFDRIALLLAGLMCAASLGAVVARPSVRIADESPPWVLETAIPRRFGPWRAAADGAAPIVNPQTQALLDKLYSQILSRTYVNGDGDRIMLSIAYGGDQREGLQAHRPEVCYPAQGFALRRSEAATLATPWGPIAARRMLASLGPRQEPVTYWYTVGNHSVGSGLERKWIEIRFGLTGRIPDGLLFRVSSLDRDPERAYALQAKFIAQLLAALSPAERLRLGGVGGG